MNVEKAVKEIVCDNFTPMQKNKYLKWEDINLTDSFLEDFDVDSLDMVEIIMTFEETFDIEIDDNLLFSIVTVDDAIKTIEKLLDNKNE